MSKFKRTSTRGSVLRSRLPVDDLGEGTVKDNNPLIFAALVIYSSLEAAMKPTASATSIYSHFTLYILEAFQWK